MALQDLLDLSDSRKKIGLSEERVRAVISIGRQYIAYWREYPDMFVDYLLEMGNPQDFKFFFYQRVFLRIAMRHQYVYAVFPRAYSKSFLSIMTLMMEIRRTFFRSPQTGRPKSKDPLRRSPARALPSALCSRRGCADRRGFFG